MNSLIENSVGPLNCLVSDINPSRKTVIVCHGYGANKDDLAGLLPYIDNKDKFNWIFPDAPLEIPVSPMMSGRAWFPISMQVLEQAMLEGKDAVYEKLIPDGMESAIKALTDMIEELKIEPSNLILVGFSQGSMVLSHLATRVLDQPVDGLVLLSSSLMAAQLMEKRDFSLDILQTHGLQDQVLPFNGAKMLEGKLASIGHFVDFVPFQGGHEIPIEVIKKINQYLKQRC